MTEIADVIRVTVNVGDTQITQVGFGTPMVFDQFAATVFPERIRSYPNIAAVAADFVGTSKIYKAAAAIFSQKRAPTKIKIGRMDPGDASITTALDTIDAFDSDWYMPVAISKAKADILEIAAWIATKDNKAFIGCSEDADVISTATTDVASAMKALNYDNAGYLWHHQAGVDASGVSYTVTGGVATIAMVAHGLRVNDPVTFSASTGASIDGNNIVATVPDPDTFTVVTTAADEAGAVTVNYFARYTFPEAAWAGLMLPSEPGSETWYAKELSGAVPIPRDILTPSEEANALGKNANLYTTLAGVGFTHKGVMSSGRFIDIQRGIDWLTARLSEAIVLRIAIAPKIPYTDPGMTIFHGDIAQILDRGARQDLLGPLQDGSGDIYRIFIPKVASQLQADRVARHVSGITVECQIAGAAHSLSITLNAKV